MTSVVPNNTLTPFTYVSFDSSRAFVSPTSLKYKIIIGGTMLAPQEQDGLALATFAPFTLAASATPRTIYKVSSADQAGKLWGFGSMLHDAFVAWYRNNKTTEVYGIGYQQNEYAVHRLLGFDFVSLNDDGSVGPGTISLTIGSRKYSLPVSKGTLFNDAASKMVALVNADPTCPFMAATNYGEGVFGALMLQCKWAGDSANQVTIGFNLGDNESYPDGMITQTHSGDNVQAGTDDPDASGFISDIGDTWYQGLLYPFANDEDTLDALDVEMEDRFGPIRQIDGRVFTGIDSTKDFSQVETYGTSKNSKHLVQIDVLGMPTEPWVQAAIALSLAAREGELNPARPFTGLAMLGSLPPSKATAIDWQEREALLHDGVVGWKADDTGVVRCSRMITSYRLNDSGAPDVAYLDLMTLHILSFIRWDLRSKLQTKFQRSILLHDSDELPVGVDIVTPNIMKAECVSIFREWQAAGYVQGVDQFINDLTVDFNSGDPNRLDVLLPPELANSLMVTGVNIQYLLQAAA